MKILLNPCFQMFDEKKGGSDPLVAYAVGNSVATKFPDSLIVTGFKEIVAEKPYKIIELNKNKKLDLGVFSSLIFNLKYTLKNIQLFFTYKPDIVHHVLPFWPGRTYNLSLWFTPKPIVIGPVFKPVQRYEEYKKSKTRIFREKTLKQSRFENFGQQLLQVLSRPLKFLSLKTLQKANVIIATNKAAKAYMTELGVEAGKIKVIPPGVILERFKYVPFAQKFDGTLRLLAVGYLIERKGFDLILLAFSQFVFRYSQQVKSLISHPERVEGFSADMLRQAQHDIAASYRSRTTVPDGRQESAMTSTIVRNDISTTDHELAKFELRIIGVGPELENLKNLAEELGIADKVKFIGFIDNIDLHKEYENAHVFLNMSKDEGFATTALEACAAGLPIISSRVGGFDDIVVEGKNGYLVEQGNYKQMAKRIKDLVQDFDKIQNFGAYSRKLAETKYDWELIIDEYVKLYLSLRGMK